MESRLHERRSCHCVLPVQLRLPTAWQAVAFLRRAEPWRRRRAVLLLGFARKYAERSTANQKQELCRRKTPPEKERRSTQLHTNWRASAKLAAVGSHRHALEDRA